jgi:aldehyde dehydrogenase (NAD+)
MNQKFKQMAEVMSGIDIKQVLQKLGIKNETNKGASTGVNWLDTTGEVIESHTPVDGSTIGTVRLATKEDYDKVVMKAHEGFLEWRKWTAPQRGEVVRQV